jgi:hypothetical protein
MDLEEFLTEWHNDSPTVLVHTSGSTGKPKPMWVEKRRMEASARMTCDFLGLREGDTALLCLPLDYIAGKMVVVRSLVRGLRLVCVEPSGEPLGTVAHSFAQKKLSVFHHVYGFSTSRPCQHDAATMAERGGQRQFVKRATTLESFRSPRQRSGAQFGGPLAGFQAECLSPGPTSSPFRKTRSMMGCV